MIVTADIAEVRRQRWADPAVSWGLVPTMGYLHEGHLSLVQLSLAANEQTAVTIFVNPTQFAPTEDLGSYPRNLEGDLAKLEALIWFSRPAMKLCIRQISRPPSR